MSPAESTERGRLAALIAQSLDLADALELDAVGISLNDALVRLTGEGKAPAILRAAA